MSTARDYLFFDTPWSFGKVYSMVHSEPPPGSDSFDEDAWGWLELRAAAYDSGSVDAILDVVQYEQAVRQIEDPKAQAAVILRSFGWQTHNIGAVLGGRGERRTGHDMVAEGVSAIVRYERERRDG